ncbi:E3 ubiquitin/ISG15 ligase TRIM25-like [Tachysurus ichikawai]
MGSLGLDIDIGPEAMDWVRSGQDKCWLHMRLSNQMAIVKYRDKLMSWSLHAVSFQSLCAARNKLKEEQMKSQQRIQEKQKKLQELKQAVDIIKSRSQAALDDSERIFTELISSMEKKRSEVK